MAKTKKPRTTMHILSILAVFLIVFASLAPVVRADLWDDVVDSVLWVVKGFFPRMTLTIKNLAITGWLNVANMTIINKTVINTTALMLNDNLISDWSEVNETTTDAEIMTVVNSSEINNTQSIDTNLLTADDITASGDITATGEVKGGTAHYGGATNYATFGVSGNLRLYGTALFAVPGGSYAFQAIGTSAGTYFSSVQQQIQWLDYWGTPILTMHVVSGLVSARRSLVIGMGGAGVDYTQTFLGEDTTAVITLMEDEGWLEYDTPIMMDGEIPILFNADVTDENTKIYGKNDPGGYHLKLEATDSVDIVTPLLQVKFGNATVDEAMAFGTNTLKGMSAGDLNISTIYYDTATPKSPIVFELEDGKILTRDKGEWVECFPKIKGDCPIEAENKMERVYQDRQDYQDWSVLRADCENDTHSYSGLREYKSGDKACYFDTIKAGDYCGSLGRFYYLDGNECAVNQTEECESVDWQYWDNGCRTNPFLDCVLNPDNNLMFWNWNTKECELDPIKECNAQDDMLWDNGRCAFSQEKLNYKLASECLSDKSRYWDGNSCVDAVSIGGL